VAASTEECVQVSLETLRGQYTPAASLPLTDWPPLPRGGAVLGWARVDYGGGTNLKLVNKFRDLNDNIGSRILIAIQFRGFIVNSRIAIMVNVNIWIAIINRDPNEMRGQFEKKRRSPAADPPTCIGSPPEFRRSAPPLFFADSPLLRFPPNSKSPREGPPPREGEAGATNPIPPWVSSPALKRSGGDRRIRKKRRLDQPRTGLLCSIISVVPTAPANRSSPRRGGGRLVAQAEVRPAVVSQQPPVPCLCLALASPRSMPPSTKAARSSIELSLVRF
jgi:hypothetical protein